MINYFNIPLFRSEHVSGERISEFISFEYCILAGAARAVTKKLWRNDQLVIFALSCCVVGDKGFTLCQCALLSV